MSQLYDLFVAHESEAEDLCDNPSNLTEGVDVPAFDESKQLSLLSLFRKIGTSAKVETTYYKYFKLLHPSQIGKSRFVTKFPDDFVQAVAGIEDEDIADIANKWVSIETSFSEYNWTKRDVEGLLGKVCSTCRTAAAEDKQVLFRFSL
jgi:hypothetical protein